MLTTPTQHFTIHLDDFWLSHPQCRCQNNATNVIHYGKQYWYMMFISCYQ